nr:doublecortin domain-containing protein 2C isoform X2 [Oryctolagus cuniculus]
MAQVPSPLHLYLSAEGAASVMGWVTWALNSGVSLPLHHPLTCPGSQVPPPLSRRPAGQRSQSPGSRQHRPPRGAAPQQSRARRPLSKASGAVGAAAMGSRAPYTLVDTTPAKTILVYRNGDQFYVGKKFVFSRRRAATFEALLEQLTEQVDVPFGVRRLYTPTRGHQVRELDALQAGGKYVAAGRERFKKLDYIHIVPRKPGKMRKLKEIKPVVHCDINVPSRWQTYHRISRHINVFTNGRLFIPPIKIIIPKFSLSDWNSVLATIGEKVFPLGGVRKLFTMNGHLLDNSKDLQDNHFYVAAGLESFKHFAYWKSPKVPSEVQQSYTDTEKHPQRKKKVDSKGKEPHKQDSLTPRTQDSVYYAKEGKKETMVEPLVQTGAEGDVYKAQTPTKDAQGALQVKEDLDVPVEEPVDQVPAEIVKEDEETQVTTPDFESKAEKGDEWLSEDGERKGDHSRVSFKKRLSLRHNTKRKASLKNISKNKKVVPLSEQYGILEEENTSEPLETPVEIETQKQPPMRQQSQDESATTQEEQIPEGQELSEHSSLGQPSQEQVPDRQQPSEHSSLGQPSQEQVPDRQQPSEHSSLGQPSQEQVPDRQQPSEHSSLGQPSQEQVPDRQQPSEHSSLGQPSQEQVPDRQQPSEHSSLGQPSQEQVTRQQHREQVP